MPVSTIKSKQSGGMSAFLKKKDPNLEKLKSDYFDRDKTQSSASSYKPTDTQFSHFSEVEDFIEK